MSTEKQPTFGELYGDFCLSEDQRLKEVEAICGSLGVPERIFRGESNSGLASSRFFEQGQKAHERLEKIKRKMLDPIFKRAMAEAQPLEFFFLFPGNVKSYARKPIPKYGVVWE